jgi:hypothetical protein
MCSCVHYLLCFCISLNLQYHDKLPYLHFVGDSAWMLIRHEPFVSIYRGTVSEDLASMVQQLRTVTGCTCWAVGLDLYEIDPLECYFDSLQFILTLLWLRALAPYILCKGLMKIREIIFVPVFTQSILYKSSVIESIQSGCCYFSSGWK